MYLINKLHEPLSTRLKLIWKRFTINTFKIHQNILIAFFFVDSFNSKFYIYFRLKNQFFTAAIMAFSSTYKKKMISILREYRTKTDNFDTFSYFQYSSTGGFASLDICFEENFSFFFVRCDVHLNEFSAFDERKFPKTILINFYKQKFRNSTNFNSTPLSDVIDSTCNCQFDGTASNDWQRERVNHWNFRKEIFRKIRNFEKKKYFFRKF